MAQADACARQVYRMKNSNGYFGSTCLLKHLHRQAQVRLLAAGIGRGGRVLSKRIFNLLF